MILEALLASFLVATISLSGALFFGKTLTSFRFERFFIPLTVGIFLSLVLFELGPETLSQSPTYGSFAILLGFVFFYLFANLLHQKYHQEAVEQCDRKSAATLILLGDTIHNLADGFILGGAFLIDPNVGIITALGLAIHEIPQEIVEYGMLLRAGYSRTQALQRNFISASSVILGTLLVVTTASRAPDFVWLFTGFAAGNLLFLAASDLLPRIHTNNETTARVYERTLLIVVGFAIMVSIISWTHESFGHGHEEDYQRNSVNLRSEYEGE